MPTAPGRDGRPEIWFDPALEVSPFTLFRRLREGRAPLLLDIREEPGATGLAGASPWSGESWRPDDRRQEVVLLDQDGTRAPSLAAALQGAGYAGVKALFGGLDLYEFSLDPQVVGSETFLVRIG